MSLKRKSAAFIASGASLLLLSAGLVATGFTASAATYGVVEDVNLAACVNEEINNRTGSTRDLDTPITEAEMNDVEALSCSTVWLSPDEEKISDLTGLEFATSMQTFNADNNLISDLSPLAGATSLTSLYLPNNSAITDISALGGLSNLASLNLWRASISDISVLSGNTSLVSLNISETEVDDISSLATNTSLYNADFRYTKVTDISALSGLPLTSVSLGNSFDTYPGATNYVIEDLSPIAGKPLTSLSIETNFDATDLATIVAPMTTLTSLSLSGGYSGITTDVSSLSTLVNLQYLSLYGMGITDISVVENFPLLIDATVPSNYITDFSPLAGIPNVRAYEQFISGGTLSPSFVDPTLTMTIGEYFDIDGNEYTVTGDGVLSHNTATNELVWDAAYLRTVPDAAFTFGASDYIEPGGRVYFDVIQPDPVYLGIADANLAACINAEIADRTGTTRAADEVITEAELQGVTSVFCIGNETTLPEEKITSVAGLEFAINLEQLELANHNVANIDILEDADLNSLYHVGLSGNVSLTDVSALSTITSLTSVNISNTAASDISSFGTLTSLENLNISDTDIADIGWLFPLTSLKDVNINNTPVWSISGLVSSNLTSLQMMNTDVWEISAFDTMTSLTVLTIGGNNTILDNDANSYDNIADLVNLEILTLSDTDITNIDFLTGLTNLNYVDFSNTQLASLDGLDGLANLETVIVNDSPVADISALASTTALGSLHLENTSISSLAALEDLTGLVFVNVAGNPLVTDVSPLIISGSNGLAFLDISNTGVTNLSPFESFTASDIMLLANNNGISDISPLENTTAFNYVSLNNNSITDLSGINSAVTTISAVGQVINAGTLTVPQTGLYSVSSGLPLIDSAGNYVTPVGTGITGYTSGPNEIAWDAVYLRSVPSTSYNFSSVTAEGTFSGTVDYPTIDILLAYGEVSDAILAACINNQINLDTGSTRAADAVITTADLESLTSLVCGMPSPGDPKIQNLVGLDQAINLETLYLVGHDVTDLTALAGSTTLTSLSLKGNSNLEDISGLAAVTTLTNVNLDETIVSDLSPLVLNTALDSLSISNTAVTDFSDLAGFSALTSLVANGVAVVDLSDLSALTLTALSLESSIATDFSPISGIVSLEELNLKNSAIDDLGFLTSNIALTSLELADNLVTDLTPIENLDIESLDIANNSVSDISAVVGMSNLTLINASGNTISDASPLYGLAALEFVELTDNSISDISGLTNSTTLYYVGVANNSISDLSAIADTVTVVATGQQIDAGTLEVPLNGATFTGTGLPLLDELGNVTDISGAGVDSYNTTTNEIVWDASYLRGVSTTNYTFDNTSNFSGIVTYDSVEVVAAFGEIEDAALAACINEELGGTRLPGDDISTADLESLTSLDCSDAGITDLYGLDQAVNITTLNLSGNDIEDFSAIESLTAITSLDLSNTGLVDVTPFSTLPVLETLIVSDNPDLIDVSSLGSAPALEELDISGTGVTDVSGLATSSTLIELIADGTAVTDYSALSGVTTLITVSANDSNLVDTAGLEDIATLENVYLNNNEIADISALASSTTLVALHVANNHITDVSGTTVFLIDLDASGQTITGSPILIGDGSEATYNVAPTLLAVDGEGVVFSPAAVYLEYDVATNVIEWVSDDISSLNSVTYNFQNGNFSGTVTSDIVDAFITNGVDTVVPVNEPVSIQLVTTAGFTAVDFATTSTQLGDLTLSSTGLISGTPTMQTDILLNVTATDALGNVIVDSFLITVGGGFVGAPVALASPDVVEDEDGIVTVSWDAAVATAENGTVVSYTLTYTEVATSTEVVVEDLTDLSYEIADLNDGEYLFTVSYVTSLGGVSGESMPTLFEVGAEVVDPNNPDPNNPDPNNPGNGNGETAWVNCDAAAAQGFYNIKSTDPKFGTHLDRDGDGIGCENGSLAKTGDDLNPVTLSVVFALLLALGGGLVLTLRRRTTKE